jgi:hypothetical protein
MTAVRSAAGIRSAVSAMTTTSPIHALGSPFRTNALFLVPTRLASSLSFRPAPINFPHNLFCPSVPRLLAIRLLSFPKVLISFGR